MGKTRGGIKADIKSNLVDLSINFYNDDDINNSIQDAYTDIAILTQCIQNKVTLNWISKLSYYSFFSLGVSDYLGTIAIFNNVTNLWLRDDLNLKDFDRIRRDWETWIGTPCFWAPSDPSNIAICPKYSSSATPVTALTSTPPDGVISSFSFSSLPLQCFLNGLNQFLGVGYTLQLVNGVYKVTFIDYNGNTIVPQVGDDVRAMLAPNDLGTFILYYWSVAPTLASDNDIFLIASDVQNMITQYVTADLLEESQEFGKAQPWWSQYYSGIESYADRVKRNTKSDLLLRI
jgi:hypothetical protein